MEPDRRAISRGAEKLSAKPPSILLVATHPVQYSSPIFRLLASDPRATIKVAYCGLEGSQGSFDSEFGVQVRWDVPLLEGYPWVSLRNDSPRAGAGRFWGLLNFEIWSMISSKKYDAVVLYTGYMCATFWLALIAAKLVGIPVLFNTDAHKISPMGTKKWKVGIKKILWPRLFRLADTVMAPSSGTVALMRSLRIPEERITLMPFVVGNDWWMEQTRKVNRAVVRAKWNVPVDALVTLFCAKLQPWKRPKDLLRAFAKIPNSSNYLVFAGDGVMKSDLQSEAKLLGVSDRVRFLGFVNQSQLPDVYTSSDIMVLPSERDAFGVVVNEAMLCGCCVVVSDQVGARYDLVSDTETGFVFPCGSVDQLTSILQRLEGDTILLAKIRNASRRRIQRWSPAENVDALVGAVYRLTGKEMIAETPFKSVRAR